MKPTVTLWSVLIAPCLSAQVVITQVDMPDAGDTLRYSNGVITAFDPEDTGPDHLWDHSMLEALAPGADTLVTVSSTPLLYQLYFNNPFLYPDHRADYAVRGPALGVPMVTVSDVYEYYATNASSHRSVGMGASINGLPASMRRQPVDVVHRFPLGYGDVDSSYSELELALPGLGYFGQEQWRHNRVDGYGTLRLPTDTFEVVRVMSRLERWDTLYVDQFGTGFGMVEPEMIEYKWLTPGMGRPVLEIITVAGVPTTVRFHHDPQDIQTAVEQPARQDAPLLFPNPTVDRFVYRVVGRQALAIHHADGRPARRLEGLMPGLQWIEVAGLAPGVYLIGQEGTGVAQRLVVAAR